MIILSLCWPFGKTKLKAKKTMVEISRIVSDWRLRYAMAPSWIDLDISHILAVPVGFLITLMVRIIAYNSAKMLMPIAAVGTEREKFITERF